MENNEQVCNVLDLSEKEWQKIYCTIDQYEDIHNVIGLDLSDNGENGEKDTLLVPVVAMPNGKWAACRQCIDDGELIFYQQSLLAPLSDVIGKSDYIQYTVRETETGQRYIVVKDGMVVLGAIMPMRVIDEKYLSDLTKFHAICTEQFHREKKRIKERLEQEEPEEQQLSMEDAENE